MKHVVVIFQKKANDSIIPCFLTSLERIIGGKATQPILLHHHIDPNEDQLATMLSTLEANGFGYQISSEDAPSAAGKYQDIKIYAYRKADLAAPRRTDAARIEAHGS
jgi:hypothetical protein